MFLSAVYLFGWEKLHLEMTAAFQVHNGPISSDTKSDICQSDTLARKGTHRRWPGIMYGLYQLPQHLWGWAWKPVCVIGGKLPPMLELWGWCHPKLHLGTLCQILGTSVCAHRSCVPLGQNSLRSFRIRRVNKNVAYADREIWYCNHCWGSEAHSRRLLTIPCNFNNTIFPDGILD